MESISLENAQYLSDYKIKLTFKTGEEGVVDLEELIFEFINKELPHEYDRISDIFSRKGAYSRYKSFLERCGKLDEWHAFENEREKKALLNWSRENGILVKE